VAGFGINSDPFDTNIINLIVVLGIVFYFGRDFLTSLLDNRQKTILASLEDADLKYNALIETLKQAEEQLATAKQQAESIRSQSRITIETNIKTIIDRADQDQLRLKDDKEFILSREKMKIGNEIYQYMIDAALKQSQLNIKRNLQNKRELHKRVNACNISVLESTQI
jgi:F-type H+-transporting ATPase subunit b